MFGFAIVFGIVLFGAMITLIKKYPKVAVWVELFGYFILIISIIWVMFDFTAAKQNQDGQNLVINEKLDNIWSYFNNLNSYYSNNDLSELQNSYYEKTKYIRTVIDPINKEGWTKIHELTSKIQLILIAISGAMIPAGRFNELIERLRKKNVE
ncbi:hypothetical protein NV377_12690 [Paenibacillus sp. T3-5-0-4]|nr:hypothetical protein [Paenibacillus endoradicis]MCR8658168.1 hypothetical protein [Paenibacillus endoradicis]